MNANPLAAVVDNQRKNIQRIHAVAPISSKYHHSAQKIFNCCNGRAVSVFGRAGGLACSVFATAFALVETITSLAYATLTTLIHTLTLGRSKDLQNHVLKSWAFCRHSFLMIWSPFILLANAKKNPYEVEVLQHFYKINCAQTAQSIGTVFDTLACRRKGINGVNSTELRKVEVSIEGLTQLINAVKRIMPEMTSEGITYRPSELPTFGQLDFSHFLRNHDQVKNNPAIIQHMRSSSLISSRYHKFVEALTLAMLIDNHNNGGPAPVAPQPPSVTTVVPPVTINLRPSVNFAPTAQPQPTGTHSDDVDIDSLVNDPNLIKEQEEALAQLEIIVRRRQQQRGPDSSSQNVPNQNVLTIKTFHHLQNTEENDTFVDDQRLDDIFDKIAIEKLASQDNAAPVNGNRISAVSSNGTYDEKFAAYSVNAVKEILSSFEYTKLIYAENAENGDKKSPEEAVTVEKSPEELNAEKVKIYKEVKENIEGMLTFYSVLAYAQMLEFEDLVKTKDISGRYNITCYKAHTNRISRKAKIEESLKRYEALFAGKTKEEISKIKGLLIRKLLRDEKIDKELEAIDIELEKQSIGKGTLKKDITQVNADITELGLAWQRTQSVTAELSQAATNFVVPTTPEVKDSEDDITKEFKKLVSAELSPIKLKNCLIRMLKKPSFKIENVINIENDAKAAIIKFFDLIKDLPDATDVITNFEG